jgi:magnesium transporter
MLTIFRWDCQKSGGGMISADQLPATAAEVTGDDVVWIDLSDPSPEEEQRVFGQFIQIHPLTLEDIRHAKRLPEAGPHLPKVEEFSDYLFAVVNPLPSGLADARKAAPEDANQPTIADAIRNLKTKNRPQLSAVLMHRVLITAHDQPLDCVNEVIAHLTKNCDKARRGPDYLFHLILDAMVDDYAPVVDRISSRLDVLERDVFRDPSPKQLAKLLRLKRLVSRMRKTLILEREVLARLMRGEFELVEEREIAYYRNVYDHLVRYTELIESAREMVSDLMETHLAAAGNRLNRVMKFLTMISTVILPMSLIGTIYGMNFKSMPELDWQYGYPMALGLMGIVGIGSFALFRWRGWI